MLLNTKCVFWFSLQLLSKTFLTLRRNERDIIKMYISLHVKYPLFVTDFNKTWIFRTDFRKLLQYKISWKSVYWEPSCSMRTYRQTDRHDEALRNLANAPNNEDLATVIFLQISNHCWVCALITKEGHSEKTCAHGQTVTTRPQSDGAATYTGQNFSYSGQYTLIVPSMILHPLRSIPTHIVAHPQSTHIYIATDTSVVATVLIKCTAYIVFLL